jgi:hypothetical protein
MHRWKIGLAPARPVYRKRRRPALAAERQAGRRKRRDNARLSQSERSAHAATFTLNPGAALIASALLSLGLWMAIWGAVASLASAVLG